MRTRLSVLTFGGFRLLPVILLVTMPQALNAQLTFTTNNSAITITGCTGDAVTVAIPESTNGYPVKSIGNSAFANCTNLASVMMSDGITNIGSFAFGSCTSLTNVVISTNATIIRASAFSYCTALTSITIPGRVTRIENSAFADCLGLISISIGQSVTNLGNQTFEGCYLLKQVCFRGNAPGINSTVFDGADNVTVYFLSATTGWGTTFSGRPTSLWNPQLPSGYATNNGAITLTRYLEYLGPGGGVNIPDTMDGLPVVGVSAFAFNNCPSVSGVTIPASITNIEEGSFSLCTNLSAIDVVALNPNYSSLDGVLFAQNQTTLLRCPEAKGGDYAIPGGVSRIASYAFAGCSKLTGVAMSDSVIQVDAFAFLGCFSLSNITLPNNIASIGDSTFEDCFSLTSITLPDHVASLGDFAFHGCVNLTNVTIGEEVASIGDFAFQLCLSLAEVYFRSNAPSLGSFVFLSTNHATAYYLPGTAGWSSTFGGLPTAPWLPHIQSTGATFGINAGQFGFNVDWASGQSIVIEACTNLANPDWNPLQTNTLADDSLHFSDPDWTNHPARLYRVRSP